MFFGPLLNNIGFPMKEKLKKLVLLCMHFRIHRYPAAPLEGLSYENSNKKYIEYCI
jgi:hypothetical protein